ncbi:MAG: sigma-70 family RNA polymerase sigma factor [Actinomycetota bacterium]|nr:sigma-70 family RNA polymerase sigma factor [Actinomycetota bacterium]
MTHNNYVEGQPLDLDRRTENELIRRAQEGDDSALETLVRAHERFIAWNAQRHQTPAVEFEDLMQAGSLGLVSAINRFDSSKNVRLVTYAGKWIEGEIRQAAGEAYLIRVPARKATLFKRSEEVSERLREGLGRLPFLDEIAAEVGVSVNELTDIANIATAVTSGLGEDLAPIGHTGSDPLEELDRDEEHFYSTAEVKRLLESYAQLWGRLEGTRSETVSSGRRTRGQAESSLRVRMLDLERAIERLPDDLYESLEALALDELSSEEAGPWLGVHPNTVRNRYRRAITALTAYLNGETPLAPRRPRRSWRSGLRAVESITLAVRAYDELFSMLEQEDEFLAGLEVGWVQKDDRWVPLLSNDIDETARQMGLDTRPLPSSVRRSRHS